METRFKRSFLGYSPRAVERTINVIQTEFENQLKELEEQFTQGETDVQLLKEEITKLKEEMASYQSLKEQLTKVLVSAHLRASEMVFETINKSFQMEEQALARVLEYEKEAAKLKNIKEQLSQEIQDMTKRYSAVLEGSDDE